MPEASLAVYERTIRASLERIWENVLDWEHLPWLHRETFAEIRLLGASREGWRAETRLRTGGASFVVDVALERDALRYHSRTVDGPGAGTDVVTSLTPLAAHGTRIRVDFIVPDVPPSRRDALANGYLALYRLLWDQDEAMMMRRQALLDGRLDASSRTVTVDGTAYRFRTTCPHLGGPLDDATVADGIMTCPWHGYRFDVRTGRSVDGRRFCLG